MKALMPLSMFMLVLSACIKEDPIPTYGTWTVDNETFTALHFDKSEFNSRVDAYTDNATGITFYFKPYPAANSVYTMENGFIGTLDSGEVRIETGGTDLGSMWEAIDSGAVEAVVSFNGGKMSITIPEFWVKQDLSYNDSMKVHVNLKEK